MTDRFDTFNDRARKVLTLTQDEAHRLDHDYIGTEHILLGLLREGEGEAARVLRDLDVELATVRTEVEAIIGRGGHGRPGEVGLTPRAKRVIELAIAEARRLGHTHVGTGHLLLGLVREERGVAARVLRKLEVDLDIVRHEIVRVSSGMDEEPVTRSTAASRDVRQRITSGSPYEEPIGFSRAIRVGDRVLVSGTAPVWPDGSCDPDPETQATRCLEIIIAALAEAGGRPEHVVRTRIYLTDAADWQAVGRAHGRAFGAVRPAATMVVVAALLDERWKVEIEAEAVIP